MKRILAIQRDPNLSDAEKAAQRQALMSGQWKDSNGSAGGIHVIFLSSDQVSLHILASRQAQRTCLEISQDPQMNSPGNRTKAATRLSMRT